MKRKNPSQQQLSSSSSVPVMSVVGDSEILHVPNINDRISKASKKPLHITKLIGPETDLIGLERTQRLLITALRMPQIDNLLRRLSKKIRYAMLYHQFYSWKSVWFEWHEKKMELLQLKIKNTIIIQCFIRKFLARRRVARRRLALSHQKQALRMKSVLLIQCAIRRKLAYKRIRKVRNLKSDKYRQSSAILIQKVFRGYVGRGEFILKHRTRLIKQLRSWAHGPISKLLHITGKTISQSLKV